MRYIVYLLIYCFITSSISFAQEVPQIVAVKKGTTVPFDGTLLNDMAAAKMIAEKEYDKKKCDLDKEYDLLKMRANCDRDIGNIKIELDIAKKKYDAISTLKEEEIKRLTGVAVDAEKRSNNYMWWLACGAGVGVAMSIGIFFAASYGSRQ